MLTVTGLSNAEYLISSVALSIDEYYMGVGESPGVWAGRWAEALGLSGVVEAEQLRAVVAGKHPTSGVDLLAGSRSRQTLAFDLTFSAPKSVSLLWALGTEPTAEIVAAAHREAVEVALEFLEEHAAVARIQSRGVRRRVGTGGWVVAGFVHRTSREGDPQLHTHCLVPNLVCRSEDGRVVAFDGAPLFEWARAAGSVYQNHLQRVLSERLGVVWGPDRRNTREIEGFGRTQLRAFSKRSMQIETELEQKGALYESPALRMRADDEASLATRTAKDHSLTPSLLAGRWQEEAEQVGLAAGDRLDRAVCQGAALGEAPGWEEVTAALVDPEIGLCSRSARFTKADVVEHICALSAGRLSTGEITAMADRFVSSDLAVRLTPDPEPGRRKAAQWSTAAHRGLEDRTLALMDTLAARPAPVIGPAAVEVALGANPGLGEDQVAAVRVLAGDGASLRAVLAPAGFGKTTMLHTAASAATADGRAVVAVATTARAVAELTGAGLDARTIARQRVDLANGPLAAGTVVVLDEISQTPTAEVEAVLAAVDACPGGSIWVLGDPRQSQPVGAGGAAERIDILADAGAIPSARLTVNRRQIDAFDRQALELLRRGDPTASQHLRGEHGWEHEHASPAECRQAMAAAVCADIARHDGKQVAALVVSHGDAEDLADRIRACLAEAAILTGPAMTGPGWSSDRDYQTGDRVLLHARCGPAGSPLVNGTTATVTGVTDSGLAVRVDRSGIGGTLPASFVQGSRKDGSPNLSHAWARTVDGAQGGTWQACHLLGSGSLDAYRGYTGQSRSRQPTHTWNTRQLVTVDVGGILADQRDPAEVVADALARQPDPTLAARSDPWTIDRQLREQIAEHERVLAGRPTDRRGDLAEAVQELAAARTRLSNIEAIAARTAIQRDDLGALANLRKHGRDERRHLEDKLAKDLQRVADARAELEKINSRVATLEEARDAFERFDPTEGWRRQDIDRLRDQLDDHWTDVMAACVRADDPLAFGIDKLRHARATTLERIHQLDASIPTDRADEWRQARRQLPGLVRARQEAERSLADSQERLHETSGRRWGRNDYDAIHTARAHVIVAEGVLTQVVTDERRLRGHLAAIATHQNQRQRVVNDNRPLHQQLQSVLSQLDAALDHTRPERVRSDFEQPPAHLLERLGSPPRSAAGRAVWCHHALPVEAVLDRNDGADPRWTGWSPDAERAKKEIVIADQHLEAKGEVANPSEWSALADQASTIYDGMLRNLRVRQAQQQTTAWSHQAEQHLQIDQSPRPGGPELSL